MKFTSFYKIMDIETGLFSTGGYLPSWKKNGKTWSTLGHLKAHLTMWAEASHREIPKSWTIVEFRVMEEAVDYTNAAKFMKDGK